MSQQITIKVSDEVVRHASSVAAQTQRRLEEVLSAWLESVAHEPPVEELSNEEIRDLSDLQLTEEQQQTLSELLALNREGVLDSAGQRQLDELMRLYERGLLRKSQAMRIAVQRGLLEPLQ